jgi:CTP synthase
MGSSRALLMHLTLVPFIATAGEIKTKPTQHSVKELRSIGLQPDVLLCRSSVPDRGQRLPQDRPVHQRRGARGDPAAGRGFDLPDPRRPAQQGPGRALSPSASTWTAPPADLSEWDEVLQREFAERQATVRVAMVGKYMELTGRLQVLERGAVTRRAADAHGCTGRLRRGRGHRARRRRACWRADAILVPGGFGERGVEGKIEAVRYARENDIPFLGICLGMHVALIEYARNVCGLEGAHSTEMQPQTPHPIVALITEWQNADGSTQQRDESSDMGGTMRLGAQPCHLVEGTRTREIYGEPVISERHRHRYEINDNYVRTLQDNGMVIAGWSADQVPGGDG